MSESVRYRLAERREEGAAAAPAVGNIDVAPPVILQTYGSIRMNALNSYAIASRVRKLIDSEDNGNVARAAQRLGVGHAALVKLLEGQSSNINLETLTAIVRGYHVDACWLLTGETDVTATQLAGEHRGELSDVLFEIGKGLATRRRRVPREFEEIWSDQR